MDLLSKVNDFWDKVAKYVRSLMNEPKNYPPRDIPGEIVSVVGNFASVYLNGSTEVTPNIPICPHVTVVSGDQVWIAKINYSNTDLIIWTKRPVS